MDPDILRIVVLGLFGLTLGETAYIFRNYFRVAKSTRRLLPTHIAGISIGLMMLEFYVAFTTATRGIGEDFSWLIIYNITAFTIVYASLVLIRVHVTRKKNAHKYIDSLLADGNGLP